MSEHPNGGPCRHADSVGAFLLGALPPDERREFERHLEDCDWCREDVARLQVASDLLGLAVPPAAAPAALRRRIMTTVQREGALRRRDAPADRRRSLSLAPRRLAFGGAGAVAAIVAALVIALSGGAGEVHRVGTVAVLQPGGSGQLLARGSSGGVLRLAGLRQPPAGRVYEVWLQRDAGPRPQPTDALFTPGAGGRAEVAVPGSLHGVRRVMVTDEPLGGSAAPTRDPVVIATL